QGRGVHHEIHGQRRLVDAQHRQGFRIRGVGNGAADADFIDTVDHHDVAGFALVHQYALQTLELQHLVDTALDRSSVRTEFHHDVLRGANAAAIDTAHADLADVRVVVQRDDLHLQGTFGVVLT